MRHIWREQDAQTFEDIETSMVELKKDNVQHFILLDTKTTWLAFF
jgi:hypothetical protein